MTDNYNENLNTVITEIINGWEYFTIVKPNNINQSLQNEYVQNYNIAYHNFIKNLCFNEEIINELKEKHISKKYNHMINLDDKLNKNYEIDFSPLKFIQNKYKKIRYDLINHYKPLGIYIRGPNVLIKNKSYYIELMW